MDTAVVKFIGGLILLGVLLGAGLGLAVGRSDLNLCPPSLQDSSCPGFLKPQTAYAQASETSDRETFYRGAYAQCVIMGALTAPPTLTRERLYNNCLLLTGAAFRTDVYSKDLEGWSYAALAEQ